MRLGRLPGDLTLRQPDFGDVPALAALVLECQASHRSWAGHVQIPTQAEEELEWQSRFARSGAWVRCAEDRGGRIVATVAFAPAREAHGTGPPIAGRAHVNAVFVHPSRWREGIARGLVAMAEQEMRARGYDSAQLWTLEGSPATRLYESLGWRADGRRDIYPPMGLPIVAYSKRVG